jgi:hypothetical protein
VRAIDEFDDAEAFVDRVEQRLVARFVLAKLADTERAADRTIVLAQRRQRHRAPRARTEMNLLPNDGLPREGTSHERRELVADIARGNGQRLAESLRRSRCDGCAKRLVIKECVLRTPDDERGARHAEHHVDDVAQRRRPTGGRTNRRNRPIG